MCDLTVYFELPRSKRIVSGGVLPITSLFQVPDPSANKEAKELNKTSLPTYENTLLICHTQKVFDIINMIK